MHSLSLFHQIFTLALPIVISNISVPLLGLVDTAVVGHLSDAVYLAGVTLGAALFSFLFWGFGFLRMGTTGAVAQAVGADDNAAVVRLLQQGVIMALVISGLLLLLHPWLIPQGLALLADAGAAREQATLYSEIRIWSAPAVLVNYVLIGWFLAQKNSRFALQMLLLGNGINIVLDLVFVMVLGWQVPGVALASLVADYSVLLVGGGLAIRQVRRIRFVTCHRSIKHHKLWVADEFKALLRVNHQLMVRTWLLLGGMAYFTSQGAAFGSDTLAANAILMQLVMIASYALDGYAHATETLVGQAEGAKKTAHRDRIVFAAAALGGLTVAVICLLYALFAQQLVALMTHLPSVRATAADYQYWIVLIPLLAAGSYLLDGVYIGLMRGDIMRNSMFVAFIAFLALEWLMSGWGNHGLWFAFSGFMLLRSLSMALHYLLILRPARFSAP